MNIPVKATGSIRRRLTLQLVGSAAVLATILFVLVQNFARQVAEESQDSILTASVTSILDSANMLSGEVSVDIPYAALSMLGNVSDDRVFYRIKADGDFLTGYSDLPEIDLASVGNTRSFVTSAYKGDSIRMVTATRRLSAGSQPINVTVSVAQTQNGRAATLTQISKTALILGLGFFVMSAALAVLAAQSSVRPLSDLAGVVSRRGPKDLRPVGSPVPTEMVPLVTSLNNFIGRLKTSLTRSEDFIAEAAHHIRTPLATVRTQAEIALRRVERPENKKSLREMIRAIDETSRAAGQMLDHAMVTFRTDHLEREEIDLGELVVESVERFRPIAELKDIRFEIDLVQTPGTSGDPILIQNAVHNILDNAIKYSPPDQIISVEIRSLEDQIEIRVQDSGPGFPTGDVEQLTKRFVRGKNAKETVGSGLGLTIAKEVLQAHGGHLKIKNKNTGSGSCVSLYFPC